MSSSGPPPPTGPGRDRRGLGRLLNRAKTVFKKPDGAGRTSVTIASSTPQPSSTTQAPQTTETSQQQANTDPVAITQTKGDKLPEGATRVPRAQIQQERARRLGAKYGIDFEANEWGSTEGDVLRIDKAPRMRIHRQCHLCQTGFGADKTCSKCNHVRCKKCTRNPPKRTDAEKQAALARREDLIRQREENAPIVPSYDYSDIGAEIVLKRPKRTGTSDLVFRQPRVRVRRKCHLCQTLITSSSKQPRTCDNCGHKRCDDCPRVPDARKKYPFGYPNDEPGDRFAATHQCPECRTKFPRGAEDGTPCAKCAHVKGTDCPRVKPKKIDPNYNPQGMKELQARIAGLSVEDY